VIGMAKTGRSSDAAAGLATMALLFCWTLWRACRGQGATQAQVRNLPPVVVPPTDRASLVSAREDFSFLLAILTGVALTAGVVALQKVIEVASPTTEFAELAVFWLTSFSAVVLIYLSVKYGAVFIPGRIDALENTMLMLVTVAECAMFAALALGPGPLLPVRWFIGLAAFAFLAGTTTFIIWRRLRREVVNGAGDEKTVIYLRSLVADIWSAGILLSATVAFIYFSWPHPADQAGLGAGLVAFVICLLAIHGQWRTRLKVF
jgi:hypothetical protein